MELLDRLANLTQNMNLEPAEDAGCPKLAEEALPANLNPRRRDPIISQAVLPNGKRIRLLKTLLTSACERNCFYCPFRAGRDFRRETFRPEEMASTFMALNRGGIAEGIFLSSGIAGGSLRTQDQMLDTAAVLREKYQYRGYLHLKLMPGAEAAQIEQAMKLANRVSVNLEAPNTARLERLAPRKQFIDELMQPLRIVQEIRSRQPARLGWNGRWPSTTTQFVVGAVGESDLELLSTTVYLQRNLGLARAYYSAFHPVSDTPFEALPGESPQREHRLYQASFLLRDYGFDLEELPFNIQGELPRTTDPKTAWAKTILLQAPIEINQADLPQLLRIPGIGPKGARQIIASRRHSTIKDVNDLRRIGINPRRSIPFILLDGHRPPQQLTLL
jgi:predicted DNA-binding helix-hairpin-helix protein